ncbi:MAG: aminoglycoside phosphotransferase [Gemmatimonadetes bacterium]|nr:aminoglycoside phosphotransferase [Gemmatimonadota bacterium]
MTDPTIARYLPSQRFGAVRDVTQISVGLSGAAVHAVVTDTGDYVLRIVPSQASDAWRQQLAVQRLASEHVVAPRLEWVDEAGPATVSVRIVGPRFSEALGAPDSRARALASLVDVLAKLHAISGEGIEPADPSATVRTLWAAQSVRPSFPSWALPLIVEFAALARSVERDPRRVLSHNDLNPANVLWDGSRVWLVDWEVSGMTHPYYDLACVAMFLRLDDESALDLLARQEGTPLTAEQGDTFRSLRRIATMLYGLVFLSLVPDTELRPAERVDDAPTLAQCYAMLSTGALDLRAAAGQCTFGSALLRLALGM